MAWAFLWSYVNIVFGDNELLTDTAFSGTARYNQ